MGPARVACMAWPAWLALRLPVLAMMHAGQCIDETALVAHLKANPEFRQVKTSSSCATGSGSGGVGVLYRRLPLLPECTGPVSEQSPTLAAQPWEPRQDTTLSHCLEPEPILRQN